MTIHLFKDELIPPSRYGYMVCMQVKALLNSKVCVTENQTPFFSLKVSDFTTKPLRLLVYQEQAISWGAGVFWKNKFVYCFVLLIRR